jgi:hypothetical protein
VKLREIERGRILGDGRARVLLARCSFIADVRPQVAPFAPCRFGALSIVAPASSYRAEVDLNVLSQRRDSLAAQFVERPQGFDERQAQLPADGLQTPIGRRDPHPTAMAGRPSLRQFRASRRRLAFEFSGDPIKISCDPKFVRGFGSDDDNRPTMAFRRVMPRDACADRIGASAKHSGGSSLGSASVTSRLRLDVDLC